MTRTTGKTFGFFAILLLVCLWYPSKVMAQGDGVASASRIIDEVISTARQRQESLQDIPVVATALPRQVLDRYSITDLEKIGQVTPNLIIGNGSSGGGPTLYIRGVGSNSGSAGFDPAVGIVIDGVFYSRSRFVTQGFFDMEAVEILKGPQALYFGKNNSAGLISIRTSNPGDEFEAYAKAAFEVEAEEFIAETAISIPVSDTFAMRLSVRFSDMDGWLKNVAGPLTGVDPVGFDLPGAIRSNQPNEDEILGRLTMRFTPNDDFEAVLKFQGARNTDSNRLIGTQLILCRGPGNTPQLVLGVPDPFDDCKQNFVQSVGDYPSALVAGEPSEFGDGQLFSKYESFTVSLQMDYDLDDVTLSSVTGFVYYDTKYFSNADISAAAQIPFYENNSYDALSQEIRALTTFDMPVNFMVGFYFQDVDLDVRNSSRVAPLPPDSRNGRQFTWDKNSTTQEQTWSIYGEVIWDVTEEIELAGGARYTEEQKDFLFQAPFIHEIFLNVLGIFDDQDRPGKFSDNNLSPQVTLSWHTSENVTLFGAYKEGFKSGGFDNSFIPGTGFDNADLEFKSEESKGFEFGAKTRLLDETLQLNIAFYRYRVTNLQVQQLNGQTTLFFIDNAAAARTTGFEADFRWAATDELTVHGGLSYTKARYREFTPNCFSGQTQEAGCTETINPASGLPTQTNRAGFPLVNAPEWLANLGLVYEFQAGNGWGIVLSADGRYSDDYLISEAGVPGAVQDDYAILDASVRVIGDDDGWEVAIIGRNLTNEAVAVGGFQRALTGGGQGLPAAANASFLADFAGIIQRGREIMFEVTVRFN